jgi:formylglycine-generating enzyme required for sulfatase activity
LFDQLTDSEIKRQPNQTRELLQAIFDDLLKTVYAMVRGQAPPRILRGLMELEIEIGGEDGDFKMFDDRQMIDLFNRGQVADSLHALFGDGDILSAAMDLDAIHRWLEPSDGEPKKMSQTAVHFVHSWLRLFAEETGLMDPLERESATCSVATEPPPKETMVLPRPGEPFTDPVTGMSFAFVPGGTFSMGDTFGDGTQDEQPVHEVSLSPFYMAIHPVTQAQWMVLMKENPSSFVGEQHPVEQVAFNDAMNFIDQLNAVSPKGVVYTLPSEAQWEYAARSGGLDEVYAGGSDPETVAWFEDNDGGTAPVGTKSPNGLGIFDMSGNVWEWCRDIYLESAYKHHSKSDPVCMTGGRDRVIRGGSWHLDAWSLRCSRRFRFDPELFGPALGFRVVMTVETGTARGTKDEGRGTRQDC